MTVGESTSPAAVNVKCIQCGYDLRGSPSLKCPECGKEFDPFASARRARPRWIVTLLIMLPALYAPYGWLLFVQDDPGYVRGWRMMWPLLPGMFPFVLTNVAMNRMNLHAEWPGKVIFVIAAVVIVVGAIWLARRGRIAWLITVTLITLALSILNSLFAYGLFAA